MKTDVEKEANALALKRYGQFFKTQLKDLISLSSKSQIWTENRTVIPIKLILEPTEHVPVIELVSSDNTLMTKVLSVLTSLCVEIIKLKQEAFEQHFSFLSVYEVYSNDINLLMKAICALNVFVSRCEDTLRNICNQLFALYTEAAVNLNGIQLHYIINNIGEMFTVLILLEILISNTSLSSNWNKYSKQLEAHLQTPENLDMIEKKLSSLLSAVNNITTKLMNDNIIQSTLDSLSSLRKNMVERKCALIANEFTHYLKLAIANLDKLVQDQPNISNMYKCIKVNALFVLNSHLFGNNDKKIFKALTELNTKAHSIHVIGTTIWFPEQFLQRHLSMLCTKQERISQSMLKARQIYVNAKKLGLSRETQHFQILSSHWIINMENIFSSNQHKVSAVEMNLQCKTLLDGLELASRISFSMLTLINLYLSLGIPLPKSMLMSLFEIIEVMKALKNAVTRHQTHIIESINMIIQHLMFQATSSLCEVKKTLMSDKNYANKRLDELTCIVIAERALKGAATTERIVAASVALSFVPDTTYLEDSYIRLGMILEKVQTLSSYLKYMDSYCNCSWLVWHQNIVPIYFEQNFGIQLNVIKLKYFLMALEDCAILLHQTDNHYHGNKSQVILNAAKDIIVEKVLQATSQNIETNLRLHIHSHLQLDIVNPFTFDMTKKLLLAADNFRIHCLYMSVVPSVEHYLSTMYYNLTTVVLSDWKTYGEMRQMAKFKFNVTTVQDNLPTQTLEQGLDVLEIMRNIHIFVSKYLYNLNNQIFIEKSSNNKHLNSINIRHIANSIRTHGTGIMNTTVNFTYQFLKKKFYTFSQFMYDEHIKSRLNKDLRNFRENAAAMYPYINADKFNKGIKTLGLNEEGLSYLDLFRDLISQIGNAIGYVRMVRSGGRHCCSDATMFLPNLDVEESYKQLCDQNELSQKTIEAATNLDHNVDGLISDFIQGTEYFKLLVDVFAPVFRNPKNVHLKNFYIIIPPLTLNFVEYMILSKDKMTKKNKEGAAFTDDGFAMGIAYILKLLDQDSYFETLHWFESIWKHIRDERVTLEEQKTKGSVQLQQALALTEKKIKTFEEEYKLLYYSLCSARIFFK